MSTFQSAIVAVVHSIARFLPLSPEAHQQLLAFFLQWPTAPVALECALALGSLLALLLYFRHDWLSMLSGFLQVIVYRKKPMTVDERMPFFVIIATLPAMIAWYYASDYLAQYEWSTPIVAAILAGYGLTLVLADNFSRRSKNMVDWNWIDAMIAGTGTLLFLIPGVGLLGGFLLLALLRNFSREAAAKFGLLLTMPFCLVKTLITLRGVEFYASRPDAELTWLSFGTAAAVSLGAGLVVMNAFLKSTTRNGYIGMATYRIVLATAAGVTYWLRTR